MKSSEAVTISHSALMSQPDELQRTLRATARGARANRAVVIGLEPPTVQRRVVHRAPPVKAKDLKSLVALQALRLFRATPAGLVTDATWVQRPDGVRFALAVAVDAAVPTRVLAAARAEGLTVADIVPLIAGAERLSLLPSTERRQQVLAEWTRTGWTLVATWAVGVALAGGAVTRLRLASRQADARVAAVLPSALQVGRAAAALDSTQAMIDAVERSRQATRGLQGLMSRLATSLPDSSLLSECELDASGRGGFSGTAAEPFQVAARLRHIPAFADARLSAAPMPAGADGRSWYRFAVVFGDSGR